MSKFNQHTSLVCSVQRDNTRNSIPCCEVCDYCGSDQLTEHCEGITCLKCSRVSLITFTSTKQNHTVIEYNTHDFAREILHELGDRVGMSTLLQVHARELFLSAQKNLKQQKKMTVF